jgi:hypothetical protein
MNRLLPKAAITHALPHIVILYLKQILTLMIQKLIKLNNPIILNINNLITIKFNHIRLILAARALQKQPSWEMVLYL